MPSARKPMTERECQVWTATYAAAFVTWFWRLNDAAPKAGDAFNVAAQCITAEQAITLADLAVHRLRAWKATENRDTGYSIDDAGLDEAFPPR